MSLYCKHMALMLPFDCFTPKHHLCFHLLHDVTWMGNPTKSATWLDESLNKTLKRTCKSASAATCEATALLRMQDVLRTTPRPAKRPL